MEVKQGKLSSYLNEQTAEPTPVAETQVPQNTEQVAAIAETPSAPTIANVEPIASNAPTPSEQQPVTTPVEDEIATFNFPQFDTPTQEQSTATQSQQQTQAPSIDDLIKNTDRTELLKKLGLDDFEIGLHEHRKNGGKTDDYLNAKGINWESVSDTDILKMELKNEFPEATPAQIERLINKKYSQTDVADDEDKEDGLLLMKADARKARQQKIVNQQKFKIQDAVQQQQPQAQQNPEAQKAAQKQSEFFNKIVESEATKNLFQSKRVAIQLGEGVKPVNVNIPDPRVLLDVLFKPEMADKIGRTQQGEPDVQFWHEAALFLSNPTLYKSLVRGNPKALALKEVVEEGQNPSKLNNVIPMNAQQFSNVGEAFNKGTIRQGKVGNYQL